MNPIAITFVMLLASPLDSKSFHVRERARQQLATVEPMDCFLAVHALKHHKSLEVSEAARRLLEYWPRMAYERELRELAATKSKEDRLVYMACYGPIGDKPWRFLNDYEMSIESYAKWKPWAIKTWRTKVKPMLDAKYANRTDDLSGGLVSVLCGDNGDFYQGQLAAIIWQCRIAESKGKGVLIYPCPEDW